MLGKTTTSSSGISRNLVMRRNVSRYLRLSTIEVVEYRAVVHGPKNGPGRRAIACEAWQLVSELCTAVRDRIPELAAELELSPAQCHVLKLIDPAKPIAMRTLAEALGCDASNITGIVDRLEARGLVERRTASHDRRVKTLAVTRRGIE